jgi:kynurenine 3-monooxygenase
LNPSCIPQALTFQDLRDPGVVPLNFTKSINLALSERGINSVRQANRPKLLDDILQRTIPMTGRMIHGEKSGKLTEDAQEYDVHGRVSVVLCLHGD